MQPVPWHHAGPIQNNNPFTLFGEGWCNRCRTVVSTTTESSHRDCTFVISQRCDRCGKPMAYGYYINVPLITDSDLPSAAMEWIKKPGRDRR